MNRQPPSKAQLWGGRVASALPVIVLGLSGIMKFAHNPEMVSMVVSKSGFPESTLGPIGAAELLCAVLYAIPRTCVLGAILATGFLGGAAASQVRIADSIAAPLVVGVLVWIGLFLRDPRIRALLPLRTPPANG